MTVGYNGKISVPINTKVTITLNTEDIIRWIDTCSDIESLKYISRYAKSSARALETFKELDVK